MNYNKQFFKNHGGLQGKTVAITGATGGIGCELCDLVAGFCADIVLLCRSAKKAELLKADILKIYPETKVSFIPLDLEDINSVKTATESLLKNPPDILIHNAGAYSIPRHRCNTGFDNVFQINFLSPYYMTRELLSADTGKDIRFIAVGSIAHNYSKSDISDPDFSTRTASSIVYGNAKRWLTLSLYKLFENKGGYLSVTHPGITFTNITAHYPKLIFAVIKHPMKIIFMKPRKAAFSIIAGIFDSCRYREWIGPRLFNIWGIPSKKILRTFSDTECEEIFKKAEEYCNMI